MLVTGFVLELLVCADLYAVEALFNKREWLKSASQGAIPKGTNVGGEVRGKEKIVERKQKRKLVHMDLEDGEERRGSKGKGKEERVVMNVGLDTGSKEPSQGLKKMRKDVSNLLKAKVSANERLEVGTDGGGALRRKSLASLPFAANEGIKQSRKDSVEMAKGPSKKKAVLLGKNARKSDEVVMNGVRTSISTKSDPQNPTSRVSKLPRLICAPLGDEMRGGAPNANKAVLKPSPLKEGKATTDKKVVPRATDGKGKVKVAAQRVGLLLAASKEGASHAVKQPKGPSKRVCEPSDALSLATKWTPLEIQMLEVLATSMRHDKHYMFCFK